FPSADATRIAWFRTGLAIVSVAAIAVLSLSCLPGLGLRDLLASIRRPVLATFAMSAAVALIAGPGAALPAWAALGLKVVTGVATYGGALLILWQVEGRPEGAESW